MSAAPCAATVRVVPVAALDARELDALLARYGATLVRVPAHEPIPGSYWGGTDEEECGVCYLQLLLADSLTGFGHERCAADVDAWGYSFREGAVHAWLAGDARFAREWLCAQGLVAASGAPTWKLRE